MSERTDGWRSATANVSFFPTAIKCLTRVNWNNATPIGAFDAYFARRAWLEFLVLFYFNSLSQPSVILHQPSLTADSMPCAFLWVPVVYLSYEQELEYVSSLLIADMGLYTAPTQFRVRNNSTALLSSKTPKVSGSQQALDHPNLAASHERR